MFVCVSIYIYLFALVKVTTPFNSTHAYDLLCNKVHIFAHIITLLAVDRLKNNIKITSNYNKF